MTSVIVGLVFWFLETWYFGWNSEPSCTAERVCDGIALGFVWLGIIRIVVRHEIKKEREKEIVE